MEGSIPAELDGWYLRNGPDPRQPTENWLAGEGMVHGVRIEKGRAARYRNCWMRTESFENYFPVYNADGTRMAEAVLAADSLREASWRTLMRVHGAVGDYDGVITTFAQCEKALRAAGITPAASTRALLDQLRR